MIRKEHVLATNLAGSNMKQHLKELQNMYQTHLWLIAKVFLLLFFVLTVYSVSSKTNTMQIKQTKLKEKQTVTKTHTAVANVNPTVNSESSLQPAQVTYPSQVLSLTNWKITLPTGPSENPTEIKQPELATFSIDPWFVVMPEGNGVRFRAAVNGVTTKGSGYPRSELREMTNNGTEKASWSSTEGIHTMLQDLAITAVPKKKKHVVAGQIHDKDDDVIVIRLEYPNLYVKVNGKNVYKLDSNYTLGKRFTVKFVAEGGLTKVYYNNSENPVYTLNKKYSDAYFKTGAYTQSNCSKEGVLTCNENNYGEVIVYNVTVAHQ